MILVGHSYGGAVITEAGNDPKVVGLVYIAAFAPDRGESVSSLIQNAPPGAPVPPILPPENGFLFLEKGKFAASFAADVEPEQAAFMAERRFPCGARPSFAGRPLLPSIVLRRDHDSSPHTGGHPGCRFARWNRAL